MENLVSYTPTALAIRSAASEGKETRTISGYAIRFNEESVALNDWGMKFIEIIDPSCVNEEWLRSQDVKMTLFHNREKLLARWNKGEGTLRLFVDKKGVRFEFDAPDNEVGRYAIEAVERGDLAGCSFIFQPDANTWAVECRGDDETVITHKSFRALHEMTIESDPAYPSTIVGVRSFCEDIKKKNEQNDEAARAALQAAEAAKRSRQMALANSDYEETINY